jgi:hypothetical protein
MDANVKHLDANDFVIKNVSFKRMLLTFLFSDSTNDPLHSRIHNQGGGAVSDQEDLRRQRFRVARRGLP